jgi:hypothetical protein
MASDDAEGIPPFFTDDNDPTALTREDDPARFASKPEAGQGSQPPQWWRGKWPAGGIGSMEDLEKYLNERLDQMIVLSWSGVTSNHEIGNDLGRQAVENGHAVIGHLGLGFPRPTPEQLTYTGGIEAALENLLHHINPDWGKGDFTALAQADDVPEPFEEETLPANDEQEVSQPVKNVTITLGDECYGLRSDAGKMIAIPPDLRPVFGLFVQKVYKDAQSEFVGWKNLNQAVFQEEADPNSASPPLRKALSALRAKLAELGATPDGKPWLQTTRGRGACLNASVVWQLDEAVMKHFGQPKSAWTSLAAPKTMEQSTPDRGQRLPSLPRRAHRSKYEREDGDDDK